MKATDLRIGNLVLFASNEIKEVNLTMFKFIVNSEKLNQAIPFEGIPLTEEWANKFGYDDLIDMACELALESKYDIEITSEDLKNLNVHEAQNLWKELTGKELTLK